jgi:ABC-2 type transport system permease protein
VLIVAMIIGFRPQATVAGWGLAFLLIFCFTFAFTWVSVLVGLIAKSPETATLFTVLITLLPYLSSGFVPTETMPRPLAIFAEYQPMSPIIHSLRGLLLNLKDTTLISAFSWCGGIVVVSWFLARMLYQKRLR